MSQGISEQDAERVRDVVLEYLALQGAGRPEPEYIRNFVRCLQSGDNYELFTTGQPRRISRVKLTFTGGKMYFDLCTPNGSTIPVQSEELRRRIGVALGAFHPDTPLIAESTLLEAVVRIAVELTCKPESPVYQRELLKQFLVTVALGRPFDVTPVIPLIRDVAPEVLTGFTLYQG